MQSMVSHVYILIPSLLSTVCSTSFAQDRAAERLLDTISVDMNETNLETSLVPSCSEIAKCVWMEKQDTEVNSSGVHREKNVGSAVLLEWLIPIAGHLYAGCWRRGTVTTAVRLGGAAVAYSPVKRAKENDFALAAGLVFATGGTVWALVSAAHTVRD